MRATRLLKVAAKTVFALVDPLFGPFPGPRILIYHQVGVNLGREMEVPIDTFRRQLEWMQSHGEIVDLETAIKRRGEPDAHKLFVLTFDDGFEDVYHNAFPLLKERGLPFTLYLTTNPIETGEPLDPRYPEAKPLTWDQINEMVGTGLVTVGAHTHTHPDLQKLAEAEIAEGTGHIKPADRRTYGRQTPTLHLSVGVVVRSGRSISTRAIRFSHPGRRERNHPGDRSLPAEPNSSPEQRWEPVSSAQAPARRAFRKLDSTPPGAL